MRGDYVMSLMVMIICLWTLIKSFWDALKSIGPHFSAIEKDLCIRKTIDFELDGFTYMPVSGFTLCNLKGLICLLEKSSVYFELNNKRSIVKKASMMTNKFKSGKQLCWRLSMILWWWLGSLEFVLKFKYYLTLSSVWICSGYDLLTIEINAGQCYVKSLYTWTANYY